MASRRMVSITFLTCENKFHLLQVPCQASTSLRTFSAVTSTSLSMSSFGPANILLGFVADKQNSTILTEEKDIKDRWQQYCERLYASQEEVTDQENDHQLEYEEDPDILLSEVEQAIKRMRSGKSPGFDNIQAELLKESGTEGVEVIYRLCCKIWKIKEWPEDWKKAVFLPLPKKGDTRECGNNCTISLISHASKVMLHIIAERIRLKLENYSKAFDCVQHQKLWNIMRKMGFSTHLTALIRALYQGQEATVRTECGDSGWFSIGQGCILSPFLFNIYAEYIMRKALDGFAGGVSIGGRQLTNLRYADDTTLIARTAAELQHLIDKVKYTSEDFGLFLNI
ncbi:uncharacterized protein LOC117288912 [Asterias rubens]|uniref:uncharacterized protein LOC117288912 n=1 Tax=Asterias rubens TaxID=7604 RepID=UPI0014554620|nr:uncharacterized protein LOC117288912 [Asterias rubens]